MKTIEQLYNQKSIKKSEIRHIDTTSLPMEISEWSARRIIWHLFHQIQNVPVCAHPDCQKDARWQKSSYGAYCSKLCSASDPKTIEKTKETIYKKYGGYQKFISKGIEKRKKTNLERYGVENPFASKTIRNQIKQTNLERYGVENPGGTLESQLKSQKTKFDRYGDKFYNNHFKSKETNLNRRGVEYPTQDPSVKQKQRSTFQEKWGGYLNQSKEISQRIEKTKLDRYNDPAYSNRSQAELTNIERYGVENVMKNASIKEKHRISMSDPNVVQSRLNTMKKKYGFEFIQQKHIDDECLEILKNRNQFIQFCNDKTINEISNLLGVHTSTIYNKILHFNCKDIINISKTQSQFEYQVNEFLQQFNLDVIRNDRSLISPLEIDFYQPDFRIAIECNGDYWHSDFFKDKNYHYNKWKLCHDQGIHLVSIGESDWYQKKSIIENVLMTKFNCIKTSIGARKCHVTKVKSSQVRDLLDQFHLQGFAQGSHTYAAYDQNQNLVGTMIFGWTRGSLNTRRFELKRWATVGGCVFPGLFSKVFKYAQKDIGFERVISFSDNRWFDGNVYEKNGFRFVKTHSANYFYIMNGKSVHKQQFMKSNITKTYPEMKSLLEEGMTENQAIRLLGALKIWDCGKIEWEWIKS